MHVTALVLEDFRNYARAEARFEPGINLIVGRNAQGKTNLLEAVYCLSGFGSPRGVDAAVVRRGAERGLLHGVVARGARRLEIDLEIRPGRGTRALVNKTPAPGRVLNEAAASVFFGPDELSLIKGSPEGRRRFLDDLVVKLKPARDGLRREWERVLRQRNTLLRTAPGRSSPSEAARTTLEVWDESLCRVGASLTAARLDALGRLTPLARKRYEEIAGGGSLEVGYASGWLGEAGGREVLESPAPIDERELAEVLRLAVEEARSRELERGVSLVGPQRDDAVVRLASEEAGEWLDARAFASQGDQRTCALALKLAEFDLLSESLGEEPILLLDDVFSELDPARRAWLSDAVRTAGQALLTSAEPGATEAATAQRVMEVSGGTLRDRG